MGLNDCRCVTTEVQGKVDLFKGKKGKAEEKNDLLALTEGASQWLPGQRNQNVSYISRMQCVQVRFGIQHKKKKPPPLTLRHT